MMLIITPDVRAAYTVQTLKVRATPYSDGSLVSENEYQPINGKAELKDSGNFIANLSGLSKNFDYRFAVLFGEGDNEKILLQNHVGVASITEGASFNVNIHTSFKTLVYEKWLENNSTDKSFKNFTAKSAESNYIKDSDFASVIKDFPYSDYQKSLVAITSGQTGTLPTIEAVNTEKLPATDKPVNPEQPESPTDPMVVGKIGDFDLKLVTKDTGYTYEGISHNSTYKSTTAWYKVDGQEAGIPANLIFLYKTDDAEKFTSYDIMQDRDDVKGGTGFIPTNILGISDSYAVITAYDSNPYFDKDNEYDGTGNDIATFSIIACWAKDYLYRLCYTDKSNPDNYGFYCDVNSASIIAGKYIAINPKSARHNDGYSASNNTYVATNTIAVYTPAVIDNKNVFTNYQYYNDLDNYKVCKLSQASNGNCYLAVTSNNNDLFIYNLDNSPKTPVVSCNISGDLKIFNCLRDGNFYVETPSNSYIIRSNNDVDVSQNTSNSGCYMDDSGNIYQWYSAKNDILKTTGLNDQVTLAECKTSLNGILDLVIDKNSNKKTIYVW